VVTSPWPTWAQLGRLAGRFLGLEARWKARLLSGLLVGLLLAISGLNVVNSSSAGTS
jgi:hypothetical protein